MKVFDILKTVGTGLISTMVPGGPLIVGAINAALPADKQLPADTTGVQAMNAIAGLPTADQALILERQFDVDITQIKESHSTVRAMLDAESQSKHTTRPYIAKGAFHVVAFAIVVAISIWAVGVLRGDDNIVSTVVDGWPFVLSVIGPLIGLLWAYFGILKTEHKNRLDAANGLPGVGGWLSRLFAGK